MIKGLRPSNDIASTIWVVGVMFSIYALMALSWIFAIIGVLLVGWAAWRWKNELRWGALILGALPIVCLALLRFGFGVG